MVSLRLAVIALAATSCAAFAPSPAFGAAKVSSSSLNANIADTIASLQGPAMVWGADGIAQGKGENDFKGYDDFTKFTAAANANGVMDLLRGPGPFTVFLPSDSAVSSFKGDVSADVLKYHIVEGKIPSGSISGDMKTVQGETITYCRKFRKTFVDDAIIGQADNFGGGSAFPTDVECDNGIIHTVAIMLAPGYVSAGAEAGMGGQDR
jgi:uncharacterized surface protein with fasciclin (FAS1) repeats